MNGPNQELFELLSSEATREKIIAFVLENKEQLDTKITNDDGRNFLKLALLRDDVELVELFLKMCKSDPDSASIEGVTALHMAAQRGYVDICEILLQYGANINAELPGSGNATPLILATMRKQTEVVNFLAQKDQIEIDAVFEGNKYSALFIAISQSSDQNPEWIKIIDILINAGASLSKKMICRVEDQDHIIGIMNLGIASNNNGVMTLLLRNIFKQNDNNQEILTNQSFGEWLIEFQDKYNYFDLVEKPFEEMIKVFNFLGSQSNNMPCVNKEILYKHVVDYITNANSDFFELRTGEGNNLLQMAIVSQTIGVVDAILNRAPNQLEQLDSDQNNAMHYAVMEEINPIFFNRLMSHLFVDGGYSEEYQKEILNQQNANKDTLLHLAVVSCHNQELQYLKIKYLLDTKFIDVNILDKCGYRALEYAIVKNNYDITDLLLGSDPDLSLKGMYGLNLMDLAAFVGNLNAIKLMLEYQQDVPYSVVHMAVAQCHLDLVQYFIEERGLDISKPDEDGCTPFFNAVLLYESHMKSENADREVSLRYKNTIDVMMAKYTHQISVDEIYQGRSIGEILYELESKTLDPQPSADNQIAELVLDDASVQNPQVPHVWDLE